MSATFAACRRMFFSSRSSSLKAMRQRKSAYHSNTKEELLIEEAPPSTVKWGVLRISAVVVPFTYFGAMLSKRGAEFLEEWNIFVPEDDED